MAPRSGSCVFLHHLQTVVGGGLLQGHVYAGILVPCAGATEALSLEEGHSGKMPLPRLERQGQNLDGQDLFCPTPHQNPQAGLALTQQSLPHFFLLLLLVSGPH